MAKGDTITVLISTGEGAAWPQKVTASKAGRKVRTAIRTRQKMAWLDVEELTRTNRLTGNKVTIRLDRVVSIEESYADPDERPVVTSRRSTVTAAKLEAVGE